MGWLQSKLRKVPPVRGRILLAFPSPSRRVTQRACRFANLRISAIYRSKDEKLANRAPSSVITPENPHSSLNRYLGQRGMGFCKTTGVVNPPRGFPFFIVEAWVMGSTSGYDESKTAWRPGRRAALNKLDPPVWQSRSALIAGG
jgi:hypothetical protein